MTRIQLVDQIQSAKHFGCFREIQCTSRHLARRDEGCTVAIASIFCCKFSPGIFACLQLLVHVRVRPFVITQTATKRHSNQIIGHAWLNMYHNSQWEIVTLLMQGSPVAGRKCEDACSSCGALLYRESNIAVPLILQDSAALPVIGDVTVYTLPLVLVSANQCRIQ